MGISRYACLAVRRALALEYGSRLFAHENVSCKSPWLRMGDLVDEAHSAGHPEFSSRSSSFSGIRQYRRRSRNLGSEQEIVRTVMIWVCSGAAPTYGNLILAMIEVPAA